MGRMNYHRNTQPHPATLPTGQVYRIKLQTWPWETGGSCGSVQMADSEQCTRLRALGVPAGGYPLTKVQASFILSALRPLEASGVTVPAIAASNDIANPYARRRYLRHCQRALNEGSRDAQQVLTAVKSSDESIVRCKALVGSALATLRALILERIEPPTPAAA